MTANNRLADHSEFLHRQVHPAFVQEGRVGSRAFKVFPKDSGYLSVDRASMISAKDAFQLHLSKEDQHGEPLRSAGTWSVSVGECAQLDLPALEDPIEEPVPDPAHCLIDFTEKSKSQQKKLAKKLRDYAEDRGSTYLP